MATQRGNFTCSDYCCFGCSVQLNEYQTHILCHDCMVRICLKCFSSGMERNHHINCHCYEVMKSSYVLFDKNWNAVEELDLLNAIVEYGFGNWEAIAQKLQSKTSKQCKDHYLEVYINNDNKLFPDCRQTDVQDVLVCNASSHLYPFRASDEPPRPEEDSILQKAMAGYMAARADFSVEHKQHFEDIIMNVEQSESDDELDREMNSAVIDIYRTVIKERYHRKRLIRKHGLIRNLSGISRDHRFEVNIGSERFEQLKHFAALTDAVSWDKFLEGLCYGIELRRTVNHLQRLRREGIQHFHVARVYERLLKKRENDRGVHKLLGDVVKHLQSDYSQPAISQISQQVIATQLSKGLASRLPLPARRAAPPLDLTDMPSSEKLSSAERNLCASLRLLPDVFLNFKQVLVNECRKSGCVKLVFARNALKIDVNKTRKVYDFLINEGLIWTDVKQ